MKFNKEVLEQSIIEISYSFRDEIFYSEITVISDYAINVIEKDVNIFKLFTKIQNTLTYSIEQLRDISVEYFDVENEEKRCNIQNFNLVLLENMNFVFEYDSLREIYIATMYVDYAEENEEFVGESDSLEKTFQMLINKFQLEKTYRLW